MFTGLPPKRAYLPILELLPPPALRECHLLASRKLKARRTINDLVEDQVVKLWEDKTFSRHVDGVYDSMTVEGSMDIDDVMAAQMIRDAAKKSGSDELAEQKLDTMVHAMRVVLRRYGQGRKERREMMGGEVVPEAPTPPAAG